MSEVYRDQYEARLGKFLLLYNHLENLLGDVLAELLKRRGKSHLYCEGDFFKRKLDQLELVCELFDPLPKPDFPRLRDINRRRNELAHGHMLVHPATQDIMIQKAQNRPWTKVRAISPADIERDIKMAEAAVSDLEAFAPYIWFVHTPPFPQQEMDQDGIVQGGLTSSE